MGSRLRKDLESERARWSCAMHDVARDVGEGSPLYRAMGTLAWGRYEGEPSPSEGKDNVSFGLGFLQGARYALLHASEVAKWDGCEALRRIHDQINAMRNR